MDPDLQLEMVKPVTSIKDPYCRLSVHLMVAEWLKCIKSKISDCFTLSGINHSG